LFSLTGRRFDGMPAIGGFNMTYLRMGASPSVLSKDEHRAPIVAAWQAGTGRVLVYTGEIDGQFTGAIGRWPAVGDYYTSLVRWTAGARSALPADMLVTQQVSNGVAQIALQLDPERLSTPVDRPPRVTTLAGAPGGGAPAVTRAEMTWRTPDELTVEIPLNGSATYLSTVDVPGVGRVTLPPVALPYSPELAPSATGEGRAALEKLARDTGGIERIDAGDVWKDLPQRRRRIPLRTWLVVAAVVLLLFEVLERRTRILGAWEMPDREYRRLPAGPGRTAAGRKPAVLMEEPPPAPPADPDTPLLDALDKAGKRARRRV
jgi:hypothetical protein